MWDFVNTAMTPVSIDGERFIDQPVTISFPKTVCNSSGGKSPASRRNSPVLFPSQCKWDL
jgi:hypothetical protein